MKQFHWPLLLLSTETGFRNQWIAHCTLIQNETVSFRENQTNMIFFKFAQITQFFISLWSFTIQIKYQKRYMSYTTATASHHLVYYPSNPLCANFIDNLYFRPLKCFQISPASAKRYPKDFSGGPKTHWALLDVKP